MITCILYRDAAYTLRNAILDSMDRHTQDTKQEEAGEKEGKEATNMSELARYSIGIVGAVVAVCVMGDV